MGEINKPTSRTFWKITSNDGTSVVHEGLTDINQVTTTGQPILNSSTNADTLYPPLPSSGTITAGEIYSYEQGMVQCIQTHERTIYPPDQTPALFNVYRANTEGMAWIADESVVIGDKRTYAGDTWQCLQSHVTRTGWEPPNVPALWNKIATTSEWTVGVAYKVNDIVTYQGPTYKCLQAHTSQAGWTPPAVPALWQLQ